VTTPVLVPRDRIAVALDVSSGTEALRMVRPLAGHVGWAKVGKQLFTAEGPPIVRELRGLGLKVFLDLKFHDIPTTVAAAGVEAARLGVDLFNVHASGGRRMMEETVRRVRAEAAKAGAAAPKVVAVTVLTSLEAADLHEVGLAGEPHAWVRRWAVLARDAGLDGVVCSAREAALVRAACGPAFWLVTPGIRQANAPADDQRRTMTAGEAVRAGATLLVIGRPLTQAPDPAAAAGEFAAEIAAAS
jgi:orotidine-5'-phosphate decarboxylase